jgi:DeoR/GlpR family transcriptional regulator of sugar metabolism
MIGHLGRRRALTVVTNNLNIASLLAPYRQITVIMTGGVMRHSELSLLGALAEDALGNLRVDKLFIGSSAIDTEYGLSADDPAEVQTDRALMAVASEIIVLADHTKFERKRTMRVVPIQRIAVLITDRDLPEVQRTALDEAGVDIEIA